LLIPGIYVFRVLEIDPRTYLKRTLSAPLAGAAALVVTTGALRLLALHTLLGPTLSTRALPLILHLGAGSLAYLGGYLLVPAGRSDLIELASKLRRR
jgi:hypothetical protein